jgi:hypothetical protein
LFALDAKRYVSTWPPQWQNGLTVAYQAVYCTKSCQKSAWNSHKLVCRSGTATVQALPSQIAILKEMAQLTGMDLSYDKKALNAACESFGSKQGFQLGL